MIIYLFVYVFMYLCTYLCILFIYLFMYVCIAIPFLGSPGVPRPAVPAYPARTSQGSLRAWTRDALAVAMLWLHHFVISYVLSYVL